MCLKTCCSKPGCIFPHPNHRNITVHPPHCGPPLPPVPFICFSKIQSRKLKKILWKFKILNRNIFFDDYIKNGEGQKTLKLSLHRLYSELQSNKFLLDSNEPIETNFSLFLLYSFFRWWTNELKSAMKPPNLNNILFYINTWIKKIYMFPLFRYCSYWCFRDSPCYSL